MTKKQKNISVSNMERYQVLKYNTPQELIGLANNPNLSSADISHLVNVPYWEVRYVLTQRGMSLPQTQINTLLNDPVHRVRQSMLQKIR